METKEQHVKDCDGHWTEVMKLAEQYGFIIQAYGGVATLVTQKEQIKELGLVKYLGIQKMNGHCPKEFGYEGCLNEDAQIAMCGSCCLRKKGTEKQ